MACASSSVIAALAAVERVTDSKSNASSNFLMALLPETPLGDMGQSTINDSLCAPALNLMAVKKEPRHCISAMKQTCSRDCILAPVNVRFGSKADIQCSSISCPLYLGKRTLVKRV